MNSGSFDVEDDAIVKPPDPSASLAFVPITATTGRVASVARTIS